MRWYVVIMVFVATGLSFLDRQVLSIAIIKIQKEFDFTDVEYGWVNTKFSFKLCFDVYAGRLAHRSGRRKKGACRGGGRLVCGQCLTWRNDRVAPVADVSVFPWNGRRRLFSRRCQNGV